MLVLCSWCFWYLKTFFFPCLFTFGNCYIQFSAKGDLKEYLQSIIWSLVGISGMRREGIPLPRQYKFYSDLFFIMCSRNLKMFHLRNVKFKIGLADCSLGTCQLTHLVNSKSICFNFIIAFSIRIPLHYHLFSHKYLSNVYSALHHILALGRRC